MKLVLLPGLDGTGTLFSWFIAALPKTLEVVMMNFPTEQNLAYPELENLVRTACEGCGPHVLVAESFSTPLASHFAATNPPNLMGVVLCAGFATAPIQGWQRILASLFVPLVFRIALTDLAARIWLVGRDAPPSLVRAVRDAISSVQPKVLVARFRAVLACDVRAELSRITAPILYIQAERDRLVKNSCLQEILLIQPHVAVSVIDGPHLILQREPKRAAEVVVRFLRSNHVSDRV